MSRIALFIAIAFVAFLAVTGCNNMYLEINGPQLPSGVKDIYFINRAYVNVRVVGDSADNDFYVRHFDAIIYPGMAQPDRYVPIGPHKYWIQTQVASQGWQSWYQVVVVVEARPEVDRYCIDLYPEPHQVCP